LHSARDAAPRLAGMCLTASSACWASCGLAPLSSPASASGLYCLACSLLDESRSTDFRARFADCSDSSRSKRAFGGIAAGSRAATRLPHRPVNKTLQSMARGIVSCRVPAALRGTVRAGGAARRARARARRPRASSPPRNFNQFQPGVRLPARSANAGGRRARARGARAAPPGESSGRARGPPRADDAPAARAEGPSATTSLLASAEAIKGLIDKEGEAAAESRFEDDSKTWARQ
jgi:hypothetical protein